MLSRLASHLNSLRTLQTFPDEVFVELNQDMSLSAFNWIACRPNKDCKLQLAELALLRSCVYPSAFSTSLFFFPFCVYSFICFLLSFFNFHIFSCPFLLSFFIPFFISPSPLSRPSFHFSFFCLFPSFAFLFFFPSFLFSPHFFLLCAFLFLPLIFPYLLLSFPLLIPFIPPLTLHPSLFFFFHFHSSFFSSSPLPSML